MTLNRVCIITDGGDRLIVELRRSTFECLRMGRPVPTGVLPGDEAHDGATRIFGVFSMLSDSRRFGNELTTRRKLLSEPDGEPPNHQLPIGSKQNGLSKKKKNKKKVHMYSCFITRNVPPL